MVKIIELFRPFHDWYVRSYFSPVLYFSKPDAPAPPDYVGAANAQGDANLDAARLTAQLSNPNVITPYGTQTVDFGGGRQFNQSGYDAALQAYNQQLAAYNSSPAYGFGGAFRGDSPNWVAGGGSRGVAPVAPNRNDYFFGSTGDQPTVTQSLSPEGQALFDQQNRMSQAYGDIGEAGLGRINDAMGGDFDMSQVQDYSFSPDVAGKEDVTQALIDRNQPYFDRDRELAENNLMIQGHNRGGSAWENSRMDMDKQENDMRLAAILAGGQEQSRIGEMESARRAQDIQEQSFLRNLPLSEINALRTGSQPGMPQFQNYTGAQVQAAPLFDATLAQGNFAQQNYQNELGASGGIFDLVGAGLGAAGAADGFGNLFSFG